jgi:hypothetical protein
MNSCSICSLLCCLRYQFDLTWLLMPIQPVFQFYKACDLGGFDPWICGGTTILCRRKHREPKAPVFAPSVALSVTPSLARAGKYGRTPASHADDDHDVERCLVLLGGDRSGHDLSHVWLKQQCRIHFSLAFGIPSPTWCLLLHASSHRTNRMNCSLSVSDCKFFRRLIT